MGILQALKPAGFVLFCLTVIVFDNVSPLEGCEFKSQQNVMVGSRSSLKEALT